MMYDAIIQSWKAYGVGIEQDAYGHWHWFEEDEHGEQNGPYSPAFDTFERCVSDLEECFGPLTE